MQGQDDGCSRLVRLRLRNLMRRKNDVNLNLCSNSNGLVQLMRSGLAVAPQKLPSAIPVNKRLRATQACTQVKKKVSLSKHSFQICLWVTVFTVPLIYLTCKFSQALEIRFVKHECSKPELSTNTLRMPLSFWNAICWSINAQQEDGMNQAMKPTSRKKQRKRGMKHTAVYTDRQYCLQ